ncbi:hypothetical protein EB796_002429 [Bugula neritina]|uniref:Uncharacterized protein n=1 Tax=Bugula neritina TaxID=10212 RepID=A0A7J7KM45_BUGNE|nr:hypothetical protein EB796_002429 [Bugula neritina]
MATNKQTMDSSGRSSAIFGPIPRHRQLYEGKRWQPGPRDEWNPDLPYGGKVYLARKKKAPGWVMRIFEVLFVLFVIAFVGGAYFYMESFHVNALRLVANTGGASNAQHFLGQRYLHGKGVEKDLKVAMEYFKMAADQGHPHAAHNLAVGHIKGLHKLPDGEAYRLLMHALAHGVEEAEDALHDVCASGQC